MLTGLDRGVLQVDHCDKKKVSLEFYNVKHIICLGEFHTIVQQFMTFQHFVVVVYNNKAAIDLMDITIYFMIAKP